MLSAQVLPVVVSGRLRRMGGQTFQRCAKRVAGGDIRLKNKTTTEANII